MSSGEGEEARERLLIQRESPAGKISRSRRVIGQCRPGIALVSVGEGQRTDADGSDQGKDRGGADGGNATRRAPSLSPRSLPRADENGDRAEGDGGHPRNQVQPVDAG